MPSFSFLLSSHSLSIANYAHSTNRKQPSSRWRMLLASLMTVLAISCLASLPALAACGTSWKGPATGGVWSQTADWTAANAAHVVHAGLLAVQTDFFKPSPDFGNFAEREPAQLDLLPSRQIAEAFALRIGDVGKHTKLLSVGPACLKT